MDSNPMADSLVEQLYEAAKVLNNYERESRSYKPDRADFLAAACCKAAKKLAALPVTADREIVVPGMRVWLQPVIDDDGERLVTGVTSYKSCGADDGEESFHPADADCHPECDRNIPLCIAYSTAAAAEAAAGKGEK